MAGNPYQAYQVETAGPEDLVVQLYDGARRFTDKALLALEERQYEAVSLYTGRAQRILEELSVTLNHDAGDIAQNLWRLYDYWMWRLGQGLMHQEPQAYREVSAALLDMREVWADAARQVRAQRGVAKLG